MLTYEKALSVLAGGRKKTERKIAKAVQKYIKGFAANAIEKGLDEPGKGDCWGCLMKTTDGKPGMGYDHILSHFKEKYYVPSLLANAILTRNGNDTQGALIVWHIIKREAVEGKANYLKMVLRYYFRKIMPELEKAAK